jgi:F420H(2)-dependent biliverdin reductase
VAAAVAAYAERYRPPRENPQRVVVEITIDRALGSVLR